MTNDNAIYRGEAWLKRWSESNSGGRTITLQIEGDGPHQFKGYEGERFAVVIVPIGNDDKPMRKATPQAAGGHARAANLTPERRSEIASTAAKRRWHDMPAVTRAAILVQDPEFQEFAAAHNSYAQVSEEPTADKWLKYICRISSKTELSRPANATVFEGVEQSFRAWQQARQLGAA